MRGENLTLDNFSHLRGGYYSPTVYLTNTLLANISDTTYYYGANNAVDNSPFQTVGACTHYLKPNSAWRNAGNSGINSALLTDLRKRTTYPPVVLTNAITLDTTLSPQAQRDTDAVDIGWHADPLDFVVSDTAVTNATLTLTNGVVVGVYGSTGLKLQTGSKLISEGSPLNLNRFVRYNAVQEQANSYWTGGTNWTTFKDDNVSGTQPEVRLRFTEFPMMANGGWHFSGGSQLAVMSLKDCQFFNGRMDWNTNGASGRLLALTNNLFEGVTNTFGSTKE